MNEKKDDKQQIQLKTVDIKGKQYVQVNERVRVFRNDSQFKGFRMVTVPIEVSGSIAFFETRIFDPNGFLVANGHARELQSDGLVNKSSHVENAETSSIGRALGSLGIGIDSSFCSTDELLWALAEQNKPQVEKKAENIKQATAKTITFTLPSEEKIKDLKYIESSLKQQPGWESNKKSIIRTITGCDSWVDVQALPDESIKDICKLILMKYTQE